MFAPYEITRGGRTWHGDVAVKEHRLFVRDGAHCLFLVPDMAAVPVSADVAAAIARLTPGFSTLVPDELMRALRGCGLVGEAQKETTGPEEEAGGDAGADPAAEHGDRDGAAPCFPVTSLALFLTQTCNLRCVYCYGEGGEYGERGVMDERTALAAVDRLFEGCGGSASVRVNFFGGEPLLGFPLLRRVVAHARGRAASCGKQVAFGMTTNATVLTDEMIACIVEERIDLLVSCDGPPAIHDLQRPFRNGRGSYARVLANVQRLRAALPGLTAKATVCAGGDPFAVRRGLEDAGFTSCLLTAASPVVLRETGAADPRGAERAADQWRQTAERMLAYRRAEVTRLFGAVRERRLEAGPALGDVTLLAALARGRKRHTGCGAGRGMRAVAVNGDVYPCHRFVGLGETRLGHLSDGGLAGLTDFHRAVVENLAGCRRCWARHFCGGGCFYDNLARSGDMRRPDPLFCDETKTVCEDVIHGWLRLSDDDRAYVREQAAQPDDTPRP